MTNDRVAFVIEAQHRGQLRPVQVLARGLVREELVRFHTVELTESA